MATDLRAETFTYDVLDAALAIQDHFTINEVEWRGKGVFSAYWSEGGSAQVRYDIAALARIAVALHNSWPDRNRCGAKHYSFTAEYLDQATMACFQLGLRGDNLAAHLTKWAEDYSADTE